MDQITTNLEKPVGKIVENQLGVYFPKDHLSQYNQKGLPEEVRGAIEKHFQDQEQKDLKWILNQFTQPGDSLQYKPLVDRLITMTESLPPIEKTLFIKKLRTPNLYADAVRLDDENNYFMRLLRAIETKSSSNECIQFMSQAQKIKTKNKILTQKT